MTSQRQLQSIASAPLLHHVSVHDMHVIELAYIAGYDLLLACSMVAEQST
jgi:hypothetical protein